jgi:hypothetical protein
MSIIILTIAKATVGPRLHAANVPLKIVESSTEMACTMRMVTRLLADTDNVAFGIKNCRA